MLSLGSVDTLTRAQNLLESSAKRIAQGPAKSEDIVNVLQAREQFAAGVKIARTEDSLTGNLLNLLG